VASVLRAATASGVSPFVVRRWISRGLLDEPSWTLDEVQRVRDTQHPGPRSQAAHGSTARWNEGCACAVCRRAHSNDARVRRRAIAQARLPADVRRQLLDAIYAGQPFKGALRDLALTSNQVWGLTKTDGMVDRTGSSLDGHPPRRPRARHQRGVCQRLRLQGVPGAPAGQDAEEPLTTSICMTLVRAWER
jgi:hypothetical protein